MNTKIKTEERVRRLVMVIGGETLPRRQLIAELELRQDSRRNFYSNYLHPAMAKGYVCMMRPDSPSSPEQAYRLTANGLDFLEQLKREKESKKEQAGAKKDQAGFWGCSKKEQAGREHTYGFLDAS